MRTLLLAGAVLLATSCVDQMDATQPNESQDSQAVATDLTTRPWNTRLSGQYNYWPTDAVRVQVIEINGDIDPTNGSQYAYVYMVKNGATIFQLFRLLKSDLPSLNSVINSAARAVEVQNPAAALQNCTAGWNSSGPHPPPQPGGNGGVVTRAWFNQIIVDQAAAMSRTLDVITANMNTPNYQQNLTTPPAATHGIAAP